MEFSQTVNNKWHEYQITEQYQSEILQCSKIRISTTKDNYYIFTRGWDNINDVELGNDLWEYTINGIEQYYDGASIGVTIRSTITIISVDDAINFIYSKIDPATGRPWEIPIDLTLN